MILQEGIDEKERGRAVLQGKVDCRAVLQEHPSDGKDNIAR